MRSMKYAGLIALLSINLVQDIFEVWLGSDLGFNALTIFLSLIVGLGMWFAVEYFDSQK